MPKRKTLRCAGCGELMWYKKGASRAEGEATCNPCRRENSKRPDKPRNPYQDLPWAEIQRRMHEGMMRLRDIQCGCGITFQGTATRKKCDECKAARLATHNRAKNTRRQRSYAGIRDVATGERISIAALGDRDAWTCWICSEFVNRDLSGRDPWMASFDHVIPISRGGLDSWDNLRLAHLVCNIKRGNRDMAQALVQRA